MDTNDVRVMNKRKHSLNTFSFIPGYLHSCNCKQVYPRVDSMLMLAMGFLVFKPNLKLAVIFVVVTDVAIHAGK